MKTAMLLWFVAILHVNAASFGQEIHLNLKNAPIEQVLADISKQSGYNFLYNSSILKNSRPVTLVVTNKNLIDVLEKIFQNQPFDFSINNKTIVLSSRPVAPVPARIAITVRGVVTDTKGTPIPGVSVKLKGTTTGTLTDTGGRYSLQIPDGEAILVFSSIGFEPQEIQVNRREQINITLHDQNMQMNEVVVIGYGTQKKSDVTGAITSISGKSITDIPVTSVTQALQGKVAGMDIQMAGGTPGEGSTIRIRGNRSITASNDPLVVLDGIPTATSLTDINFEDIESIEVLKDASSTAIYGSRGANGVVLVTTKRGKNGKASVSYDAYYGINNPFGEIRVFNGPEYAEYHQVGGRPLLDWEKTALAAGVDTDYADYLYKTGHQQNHSLSVSGGSDLTRFFISANYFDDDGTIPKSGYKRYNFRINLDHQITDKIKVGTSTLLSRGDRQVGPYPLYSALQMNPLSRPFYEDGSINFSPDLDGLHPNPLVEILGASTDERRTNAVISNLYGEYKILKNLKYRLNLGLNSSDRRRGYYNSSLKNNNGLSTAGWEDGSVLDYTVENILNYNLKFGKSAIDFTGLYSIEKRIEEGENLSVRDLPYDSQEFYNLGSANEITGSGSSYLKWGLQSYMGRLQYSFDDKYLATFTLRADGSSRLAPGHKWGYFPSAALGWRVIQEDFMKKQGLFDDLKLRVSYGLVGNPGINPYQTQGTLSRTIYAWDEVPAYGYRPGGIPNPNLKWESTATANLGLDFSMWKSRLSGSVEFYQANTHGLLLQRAIPSSTGFSSALQNIGKTQNQGIEGVMQVAVLPASSRFQWNLNVNAFKNKTKIKALNTGVMADVGNRWFVGYPISVFYDYEKIGIWQTEETAEAAKYNAQPGQIKIKDQDNNGRIDDKDRVILGGSDPKWGGGLTNRFSYAGFDLSFTIYTRQGQMVNSAYHSIFDQLEAKQNNIKIDYWTPTNPTNDHPMPINGTGMQYLSTLRYFDGSYTTLQNATLGYKFSPQLLKAMHIGALRVYVAGQNLLLLSKHKIPGITYIPETLSNTNLPLSRTFTLGLNATF